MKVAIVGSTGAVGQEFIRLFEEGRLGVEELALFSSARSAGQKRLFRGEDLTIQLAKPELLGDFDVVFFSAGSGTSREMIPQIPGNRTVCIDNSSAFRMDPDVPLVIPEVNPHHLTASSRLIAVPNCSTIMLLMAVAPLAQKFPISRLVVSTYQSASGAGAAAMQELLDQTQGYLSGEEPAPSILPHPYAFNLFSHNSPIDESGMNEEERKGVFESRKILDAPELQVTMTCVRVPVLRAHCESIVIEFASDCPSEEEARTLLSSAPGLEVVDDRERNHFPTPRMASGAEDIFVGRIRRDAGHPRGLCLFVAGDQLLKGAALNAVQIAEAMQARGWISGSP